MYLFMSDTVLDVAHLLFKYKGCIHNSLFY